MACLVQCSLITHIISTPHILLTYVSLRTGSANSHLSMEEYEGRLQEGMENPMLEKTFLNYPPFHSVLTVGGSV